MELIEQNFFFQVYTDDFEGHVVIFRRNVFTNELTIQLNNEVAQLFGFNNVEQMMMNDEVLDRLNEFYKKSGVFPLKRV